MELKRYKGCDLLGSFCSEYYKSTSKSLHNIINILKNSHFPYTHFDFGDMMYFGNEDMIDFLSQWGNKILSLKIKMLEPVKSVELLRKLLLEQVPNLIKFEIQFSRDEYEDGGYNPYNEQESSIQLFEDLKNIQLPKLEVLVVDRRYRKFRGIIENLLAAACNLKKFESNPNVSRLNIFEPKVDCVTQKDLPMLWSLNKLQCLKKLDICLTDDIIKYCGKHSVLINMQLESLHLSFANIWENDQLKHVASSVLNQLLNGSKDVIKTLSIEPIGSLEGVIFPRLHKLRKLVLWKSYVSEEVPMFPPLLEMASVFPNLKELGKKMKIIETILLN